MKKIFKKLGSLFMAMLMLCSVGIFPVINAAAATKPCGYIINVYDSGKNYSGRYQCRSSSNFGNVGIFGKKVKIEFVNFGSQLSYSQENFYKKYARFNVYVSSNGNVKKFYANKKIGETFKIPNGKNITVLIDSMIASSGWNQFGEQMKARLPWTFAQYRLRY